MHRKSIFLLVFVLALYTLPAQAINPLQVGKAFVRKAQKVPVRSAQANRLAQKRLQGLTRITPIVKSPTIKPIPKKLRRSVFEVQISSAGRHTASAFALNVNGRVWGVTAAHVMKNIHADPYAKIINELGETISAPISSWHMGHKNGSDVAIFEIPQEILPHVEVLSPAKELPRPETETQSPAFVRGNYTELPLEDILFAGTHRILLRDQFKHEATGYCGSPVLADGKVVGIHIGAYSLKDIQMASWSSILHANQIVIKTSLHVASPIQNVLKLVQEAEQTSAKEPAGTLLKVLGHPVRLMTSQEYLSSVALLRNGFLKKEIYTHPFMNFEHLEEFFELQENDVLRITISSPQQYGHASRRLVYDVNVSTGEVTPLLSK